MQLKLVYSLLSEVATFPGSDPQNDPAASEKREK